MLSWSQKISEMYVDPKVDDNEMKGWCLNVLKSRMLLVVKTSASKKGFISHDSILINDWNGAHLKIDSGTGVNTCISESHCNFRKGGYTLMHGYNFFSLLKQFVQTLHSFNTTLINVRSPLQELRVLKVNLIRCFFSHTQFQRWLYP